MACTAVFYSLYALLFRKEKMFVFNRFYLLGSLILSFIIPLITVTVPLPESSPVIPDNLFLYDLPELAISIKQTSDHGNFIYYIIGVLAILVSCILLIRFMMNLTRIRNLEKKSEKVFIANVKVILIKKKLMPYSFMNSIFVNESDFRNGNVEAEVFEHELAHIRQRHSLDILLVEILQIFTWFNPMLFLFKRSIRINHELLADAAVIRKSFDINRYQNILLQKAALLSDMGLVSSFNFLTIKKRLIMMNKTFNRKTSILSGLLTIPLVWVIFTFASKKVYSQRFQDDYLSSINNSKTGLIGIVNPAEKNRIFLLEKETSDTTILPEKIERVQLGSEDKDGKKNIATIFYKDGKTITEDITTPAQMKAFEKKYGIKLPPPPPVPAVPDFKSATPPTPPAVPVAPSFKQPTPPPLPPTPPALPQPEPEDVNVFSERQGAIKEDIDQFESEVRKFKVKKNDFIRISKEFERIKAIYDKMADAQRINTSFFYPTSPSFFADNL